MNSIAASRLVIRGGAVVFALSVATAATACAQQEPSVPTSELVATFEATQAGDGAFAVRAEFRLAVGGPCEELASDDIVTASAGGEPVAMTPSQVCDEGGPAWTATVPADVAEDRVIVSLERRNSVIPLESVVRMVPPFDLVTSLDVASRAEELLLRWPPSTDVHAIVPGVEGDCLFGGLGEAELVVDFDSGAVAIPGGSLVVRPDLPPDSSCSMTVQLALLHGQPVAPGYAGGQASGQRVRTRSVVTTP